jgi:hypothetical protein
MTKDEPADDPDATYLRSVYANVFEWYKIADIKGQLILTLDGVLITVATGLVLARPSQLPAQKSRFGWDTWMFLAISCLALTASVVYAVICLRSRLRNARLQNLVRKYHVDPKDEATYAPAVAHWFGNIAVLDRYKAINYLMTAATTTEFEIQALANVIVALSRKVLEKHRSANRAWLFTAVSLIALFAMGASYLLRT